MIINYEQEGHYEVWVYDDMPMLSNLLMALCVFRRKNPRLWPSVIKASPDNRLDWNFAGAFFEYQPNLKVALKDALYLSYFRPWEDEPVTKVEPVIKPDKRQPIILDALKRRRN